MVVSTWQGPSVHGFREDRSHPHRSQGLSPALVGWIDHHVSVPLKESTELLGRRLDPFEPLHGGHAVPAGDDEAKGGTMRRGQWLAVHGVHQKGVGMQRAFCRQTTFIGNRTILSRHCTAIGPSERDLPRAVFESRRTEDCCQRRSRPLGRTGRSKLPRFTLGRWVEGDAGIAGAFQGRGERTAWQ